MLLIREEYEQARVLVALLVSVAFLAAELSIKPLRRREDGALSSSVGLALILIYTCVLLIKSCDMSAALCSTFGFGSSAEGLYLFFLFFGLAMILLQLIIGCMKLYFTGHVRRWHSNQRCQHGSTSHFPLFDFTRELALPAAQLPKIVLVARAHGMSPMQILQKVAARRAEDAKRKMIQKLRLDIPRLTPSNAAHILQFRSSRGHRPPAGVPEELTLITIGTFAELYIEKLFPRSACFVQVDLEAFAIRWSRDLFISLHTVQAAHHTSGGWAKSKGFGPRLGPRLSTGMCSVLTSHRRSLSTPATECGATSLASDAISAASRAGHPGLHVTYDSTGGKPQVLDLRMPDDEASKWAGGIRTILQMIPRIATPAHSRWALLCMAATSARGATGQLRCSELPFLLRRANLSLSSRWRAPVLMDAFTRVEEREQQLQLPWLSGAQSSPPPVSLSTDHKQRLGARRVTQLLLELCTSSQAITRLFDLYADDGRVCSAGWSRFVRTEQIAPEGSGGDDAYQRTDRQAEVARSQDHFQRSIETGGVQSRAHQGLCRLQLALLLLDPENDAVVPPRDGDDRLQPLSHYWTACSHK